MSQYPVYKILFTNGEALTVVVDEHHDVSVVGRDVTVYRKGGRSIYPWHQIKRIDVTDPDEKD